MKKPLFALMIASAVFFAVPLFAHAAAIQLNASSTVTVGQPFQVDVTLNAQGDDANTVQVMIDYPSSLFSLESVDDGDSIVNFWITPPSATSSGEVELAGIMPGGFTGSAGSLTSLIFIPLTNGTGTISIATATVLRNDGQGSPIPATLSAIEINAVPLPSGTPPVAPSNSLVTPNPFTPEIAQDPTIFGGKYFLVFSTTDKGTGIDHYEVLEVPTGGAAGPSPTWHVAQSPYLLQDQSLSSDIYVRAVDHAGNFIVVEVPARFPNTIPEATVIALAIARMIALALVVLFLIWFVIGKRKKS